jgi:hypothetical protein
VAIYREVRFEGIGNRILEEFTNLKYYILTQILNLQPQTLTLWRFANSSNVLCNIPSKNTSLKMATIGGRNM